MHDDVGNILSDKTLNSKRQIIYCPIKTWLGAAKDTKKTGIKETDKHNVFFKLSE